MKQRTVDANGSRVRDLSIVNHSHRRYRPPEWTTAVKTERYGTMRLINHWRHPGCGAHATVYLGDGLVAAPAKYGARVTLWDVNDLAAPRLVAELTDRPDCQAAAVCNGHLLLGSDRGIESMRFSRDGLEPVDCSPFDPQINDFDVAGVTRISQLVYGCACAVYDRDNYRLADL